ncbi:SDR family oxidoreductase [Salinarimonas ramus]|uniref:NAD(P)-dependent oxidoreductase n=1 Tax=Salinarimonas ramus TaxID=690164 RepID=A0A917V4S1_9HYPH|nr:SDR family oxidoreductase [Salinarimonas ramus]GGK36632.1 NAD(P)-dependent oxidoreductase [Salinarimonas ramus]
MSVLVGFGFGYSAAQTVRQGAFATVVGTVRSPEKAAALEADGITARLFSPENVDPRIEGDLTHATHVLLSIPPRDGVDPALAAFGEAIAAAPRIEAIVYLSTIGVYGDANGGWVDEDTPLAPKHARADARADAEAAWLALGARSGKRVCVLRLGGIYGPGRNPILQLRAGTARRIVKPGQVFNRIHVADIAQAVNAAFVRGRAGGVYNVVDDEPTPPQDVIAYAGEVAGIAPPPEIPFEEAELSPMGRAFWSTSKRVSNRRLREELGVALLYPTYREGITALADAP